MTIERHKVTGAWLISDIVAGHLVHEQYYGYTKRPTCVSIRDAETNEEIDNE